MLDVVGLGLAAGQGVRCRPLTLKARGYLRSKAAVLLLGRRILDWILDILHAEGVEDFIMITKGKENRYQIRSIVGYGEALGVPIRYSPVSFDRENTGSADATLTNLDYFALQGTVFVFPTDSVLDIDLPAMLEAHRRRGAAVTIAAAMQPAHLIAGQYGLILQRDDGTVRGFMEKPSLEAIRRQCTLAEGETTRLLPTNAGFYLMDADVLRAISRHPAIAAMRARAFDIGGHLLPWLVAHGYPVYAHHIEGMGDLGNIPSYLETMLDILHGRLAVTHQLLAAHYGGTGGLMIDPTTLALTDPVSGLTLADKMARGLVTIEPPVRIGRYVRIFPGVTLSACNIDDDCEIFAGATIRRASLGPGSLVGPASRIEDALLGFMVEIQSTREHPVTLRKDVALGDEVVVQAGVTLEHGTLIHPRLKLPRGIRLPPGTEVEHAEHILDYL